MCTNFKTKKATDGSVVIGRSLEFPTAMPTALAALPSNYAGVGVASGGKSGKAWSATHGIVGMCAFGKPELLIDGMNDAGLSAHLLYMPGGYCSYQPFKGDGSDLSEADLIAYLLGTCSSIAEVKAAMVGVNVWGFDPGMVDEVTVWDTICNLTGKRYAYRTVTDPTWYVVELASTDFTKPARVQAISFTGDFAPVSI